MTGVGLGPGAAASLDVQANTSQGEVLGGQNYAGKVIKLETNVDDCTGEALGFLMDALFEAGARDVSFVSCQMKKNRPGTLLNVICLPEQVEKMEELIFLHTTTVGIRRVAMERTVLKRSLEKVDTLYGEMQVKACQIGDKTRLYPEYDCVARVCRERGLSFQEVFREVLSHCER